MRRFKYIAIVFFALLCSCEKVVEFDIEEMERHVVVNALPCTDSALFVNITYSRFFLDNQPFQAVTDATVTVDINGTSVTSSGRDGANYLFGHTVTAGDTMTVHVNVPGHDEIVGGTRIPALPTMLPPVAEIDTLMPISMGNVTFTLDDPVGNNYYYTYILERDSGTQWNLWESKWDTIDTVKHAYFNCLNHEITNTEVNSVIGMMDYFSELLFTDRDIDGQSYEITLSLPMFKDTAEHPLLKEYTLVVESLSKEAHQYIKETLAANGMESYFAEPTRIYSNLSSKIGIFAGIARREYPLTFTYKEAEENTKHSVSTSRRSR